MSRFQPAKDLDSVEMYHAAGTHHGSAHAQLMSTLCAPTTSSPLLRNSSLQPDDRPSAAGEGNGDHVGRVIISDAFREPRFFLRPARGSEGRLMSNASGLSSSVSIDIFLTAGASSKVPDIAAYRA